MRVEFAMSMAQDEQLWNQYVGLQDEIRKAGESNSQILGIVATVVSAILAAGISQDNPIAQFFTFLCIYIITFAGYRLLEGNRRRTWRSSTYIQVFLESELEYIKWETRLDLQRALSRRLLNPPQVSGSTQSSNTFITFLENLFGNQADQFFSSLASTNEAAIISGLNWLAGIAAGISLFLQTNSSDRIKGWILLGLIVWNLFLTLRIIIKEKKLRRFEEFEQQQLRAWKKVCLIELSRAQGWITPQIAQQTKKVFQQDSTEDVQALLNELANAGIGKMRLIEAQQKWSISP